MKMVSFFIAGMLGATAAFGAEGDVGTQAFYWSSYRALDSVTYPNPAGFSLTNFRGKALLVDVFQYNCGGCRANAPQIGRLADSLRSGSALFQAVGAEIANGTFAQIQTSYNIELRRQAPNLNYPLVHVPFDTAITTEALGTRWHRYNSYRDVYFVVGYNGIITTRVDGNRGSAMTAAQFATLRNGLIAAIAAVPIFRFEAREKNGLKTGPVSLQILDLRGRTLRAWPRGPRSVLYFPR